MLTRFRGRQGRQSKGRAKLVHVRNRALPDFEDAVVAACAARAGSDLIITRNISDCRRLPPVAGAGGHP